MSRSLLLTLLVSVSGWACSGESGESASGTWDRPFAGALTDTRSKVMTSEITGRTYEISVALPGGYENSEARYAVLYAVDANSEFGTVVETARLLWIDELVPDLIIVGIGYPVGGVVAASAPRTVDLTPTTDPAWEQEFVSANPDWPAPEGSGGAPAFLQFIQHELIPAIDAEFRTDPTDRALFGHSLGGLFAIHALLNGQGTFRRFLAGSPSLWWDDEVTFEQEQAFAEANRVLRARVYFAVGALEEQDADVYWGHMVSDLERFLDVIGRRSYEGLEWTSFVFADETHTSVIPGTISRGLRYLYQD